LTDLKGYKVVYGTSASALNNSRSVDGATNTTATIPALGSGTWYFAVRAVNTNGTESANSAVVTRTISAATAAKTVNITISSSTSGTYKTVATAAYDVLIRNNVRVLGRQVGTVPVGTTCQTHYKVGYNYYKVDASYVKVSIQPRSNTIVAKCAKS